MIIEVSIGQAKVEKTHVYDFPGVSPHAIASPNAYVITSNILFSQCFYPIRTNLYIIIIGLKLDVSTCYYQKKLHNHPGSIRGGIAILCCTADEGIVFTQHHRFYYNGMWYYRRGNHLRSIIGTIAMLCGTTNEGIIYAASQVLLQCYVVLQTKELSTQHHMYYCNVMWYSR